MKHIAYQLCEKELPQELLRKYDLLNNSHYKQINTADNLLFSSQFNNKSDINDFYYSTKAYDSLKINNGKRPSRNCCSYI